MKEQVLATTDELVIRDLYPVLISNKRLYIIDGDKNYKKVHSKKIIQLDKITSIRYKIGKVKSLLTFAILFLVFALIAGGSIGALFYFDKALFDSMFIILSAVGGSLLLISLILFIIYGCKTNVLLYIEYPTNLENKPTRINFKSVKMKDFNLLVNSLFQSIDSQGSSRLTTPQKTPNLII